MDGLVLICCVCLKVQDKVDESGGAQWIRLTTYAQSRNVSLARGEGLPSAPSCCPQCRAHFSQAWRFLGFEEENQSAAVTCALNTLSQQPVSTS